MERKFRVLRIVGTLWKVVAWVVLIGGILTAIGVLLAGILGGGGILLRELGVGPGTTSAAAILMGIAGFVIVLIGAVITFFLYYGLGELIYLLLAIEENTRRWRQGGEGRAYTEAPPPSPE